MTAAAKAKELLLATAKWQSLAAGYDTASDSVKRTEISYSVLPVALVRTNTSNQSSGAFTFLPNGDVSWTLFLADPAGGDVDAKADAIHQDVETIRSQLMALAGTAQYLILRSLDISEPQYCDETVETDEGDKYWMVEMTGEWGLEF
jgi:hypothetical protein